MAISVFDLDADESKVLQLNEAKEKAEKKNISIVSSNPCFEVWYLEHFGYTTKPFESSAAVIKEVKKRFPSIGRMHVNLNYCIPRQRRPLKTAKSLIYIMRIIMQMMNLQTLGRTYIKWFGLLQEEVESHKKGSTYKYNKKTNTLAIVTKDGYVVTYFKPAKGYNYYLSEKKGKAK